MLGNLSLNLLSRKFSSLDNLLMVRQFLLVVVRISVWMIIDHGLLCCVSVKRTVQLFFPVSS